MLLLVLVLNFTFSYFFSTPKMWNLRAEALATVADYELLQRQIALKSEEVAALTYKEKGVYRSLFSQDTIVFSDGAGYYISSENYGRYGSLVRKTEEQLGELKEQIYRASVSLDDIEILAQNKDAMSERVPAIWPLDRAYLRGNIGAFGWRIHPKYGNRRFHDGIDLAGPVGTEIVTTGDGVVSLVERKRTGYGLNVIVDHGFGYKTRYAHLSKISVVKGQELKRGDKVGELGNTGGSTGPHLHYEVIHRGNTVNPIGYFSRDMSSEEFQEILANARATTYEADDIEEQKKL